MKKKTKFAEHLLFYILLYSDVQIVYSRQYDIEVKMMFCLFQTTTTKKVCQSWCLKDRLDFKNKTKSTAQSPVVELSRSNGRNTGSCLSSLVAQWPGLVFVVAHGKLQVARDDPLLTVLLASSTEALLLSLSVNRPKSNMNPRTSCFVFGSWLLKICRTGKRLSLAMIQWLSYELK